MLDDSRQPRHGTVQCASTAGRHRMAYVEWGEADNPHVLVCVHGLSRTGRDFDHLAARLATSCRVICPDIVGRGKSDWLRDPSGYILPQYVSDLVAMRLQLGLTHVDYLGTSMGGLLGMLLAAMPGSGIRRLLINDVGPHIESDALTRLSVYLDEVAARGDQAMIFPTAQAGVDYISAHSEGFGVHSPTVWRALNAPMLKRVFAADGTVAGFALRADPGIACAFRQAALLDANALAMAEQAMWQTFYSISCPTLVVRGAESDLFSRDTMRRMLASGTHVTGVEFPDVGHAPTFVSDAQAARAAQFFLAD